MTPDSVDTARVLLELAELYRELERQTSRLDAVHAGRLRCGRGCSSCCVDDISVFRIEAEYVRHHRGDLVRDAMPHAEGACAFLDSGGACRIYEHRPYVCRTQGYPLRWSEPGETYDLEMRDECPLNTPGLALEELPDDHCWTIGLFEGRLAALQEDLDGGTMTRMRLRDLFTGDK